MGRIAGALGDLSQRGEWGAVYQGWGLGVGGACFAAITTSNADVAVCGIRRGFVGDLRVLDTGSGRTSWVPPILGCV